MNESIENLEPRPVWKYFAELSSVPRGSKNEKAAADYVVQVAERLKLPVRRDACGNVVVRKPASPGRENAPVTVLQGHLDMVCEKNEGKAHDFLRDPIRLVRDGDYLKADGTTLGADNGIGVAAALAIMESKDVSHGPLELLFTIDEETGLTGAFNLDPTMLTGRRLLNLDTEEEGAIYIGCAGGMDSVASARIGRVAPAGGKQPRRVKLAGLKGGHSGLDIHEGRGNALKLLARALRALGPGAQLELASLSGGSKRNAIPREAFAVVYVDGAGEAKLREGLARLQAEMRAELGKADPGLELSLDAAGDGAPAKVMRPEDARRLLDFLHACPHGVLSMTPEIAGLVQTSTNLAIAETKDESVEISMSHRSSIESAKKDVGASIAAFCALAGFEIKQGAGYPGWKPNVESQLLRLGKEIHREMFGREPAVKAVHAGLECGIIGEKFPGMDMISIGPTITGAHSPDERVQIASVATFWKYLVGLLAR